MTTTAENTSLKNEFTFCQTLSRLLIDSLSWSNVGVFSWISIFKDCSQVQKENENSWKLLRRIRRFQVAVVDWTSKSILKSVMHLQSCYFAHKI